MYACEINQLVYKLKHNGMFTLPSENTSKTVLNSSPGFFFLVLSPLSRVASWFPVFIPTLYSYDQPPRWRNAGGVGGVTG